MVTVNIPSPMRTLVGGHAALRLDAESVESLIAAVVERYPAARPVLESGAELGVSRYVLVFVNGMDWRGLGGPALRDGDEVDLLLPMAGG